MKYKVLLVDDEEIIRQGLRKVVPWEELGFEDPDLACTGREALELINKKDYRLLITDIRMPEMDGLELLGEWSSRKKDTCFVILSGHEEFEYAREGIKLGVRHFLLKPTNTEELKSVLKEIHGEIEKTDTQMSLLEEMKRRIRENAPLVKNQFISDLLRGRIYSTEEMREFKAPLSWADEEFRIVLLMPDYVETYPGFITMNILLDRIFNEDEIITSTILHNSDVLLVRDSENLMLVEKLNRLFSDFSQHQKGSLKAIIGDRGTLGDLHRLYSDARKLSELRFIEGSGEIISAEEYNQFNGESGQERPDTSQIDNIYTYAKAGRSEDFKIGLYEFLRRLNEDGCGKEAIQGEIVSLMLKIARDFRNSPAMDISSSIVRIATISTIDKMADFITDSLEPYMMENRKNLLSHKEILAERMKDIVMENISNHQLSLRWIANNKLFASEDYLGKVFKSETGSNFTNYVNQMRVDLAKELIEKYPNMQLGEIALKTGYRENPQYFYRVFKKIEGRTPGEFKKNITDKRS